MVIAVEGMDGVGKTEVSKHICGQLGFKFIEKPLHYFYNDGADNGYADLMQVARKLYSIDDSALKSWFFTLGNIYVARMYKDDNVVVDRHFVSSYYWNGDANSDPIFKTLIEVCGKPDLTILLYATPETRLERMQKRNKFDPDLYDPEKRVDGYDKMIRFLEKYELPYVVINTENKNLEEVKQEALSEVNKIVQKGKEKIMKNEN